MIKILMYENCDLCKNITEVPKTWRGHENLD